MRFRRPSRRKQAEAIVPMINVVLLLLVFFVMTARVVPLPPFEMALPDAAGTGAVTDDEVIFLSADAELSYGAARGEAAWSALAQIRSEGRVTIRADAGMPAEALAPVLGRLAALGIADVDLAVRAP